MPYFTMRDGEKIHAHVIGDGEPCVFVHGFMAEAKYWMPLVWTLRGHYQFILMDMRGSGKSAFTRLGNKPAFAQFAEDFDDLLDCLGLERAKLLGCSQGAYAGLVKHKVTGLSRISSFLLYEHPMRAVVDNACEYGVNPIVLQAYRNMVECFKREAIDDPYTPFKQLPESFRLAYQTACTATARECWPAPWRKDIVQYLFQMQFLINGALATNWHGLVTIVDDYIHTNYGITEDDLKKISIPVTIMYGRKSELFPNGGMDQLLKNIPDAKAVVFEKSGHAFFETEPFKFRREVSRFLKEPALPGSIFAGDNLVSNEFSQAPTASVFERL